MASPTWGRRRSRITRGGAIRAWSPWPRGAEGPRTGAPAAAGRRASTATRRTDRGAGRQDHGEEDRPPVDAGLAPEALRGVGEGGGVGGGAAVVELPLPADRLPGHHLLRGTEAADGGSQEPRRGGPQAAGDVRQAGHLPGGAEAAQRGRGRRGLRQRLGGDHVQEEALGARHHFLLLFRGGAASSGADREVPRVGGGVHRKIFLDAELRPPSRRPPLL